jgi:hypothetical protein
MLKFCVRSVSRVRERTIPTERPLAKLVPTFADRRCQVVGVTDSYGRIIRVLDRILCTQPGQIQQTRTIDRWRSGFGSVTVYRPRSYIPDDVQYMLDYVSVENRFKIER